jgi:hypothetical protein
MKIIWTKHAEDRQKEWEKKLEPKLSGFFLKKWRKTYLQGHGYLL